MTWLTLPEQCSFHPGWVIWDEKLPSYIGIIISHYKDPYQPTSIMECQQGLVHVAHLSKGQCIECLVPTGNLQGILGRFFHVEDFSGWTKQTMVLLRLLKSGDHQLRLVVSPIIYKFWYISGGARFQPSTVSWWDASFWMWYILILFVDLVVVLQVEKGTKTHSEKSLLKSCAKQCTMELRCIDR